MSDYFEKPVLDGNGKTLARGTSSGGGSDFPHSHSAGLGDGAGIGLKGKGLGMPKGHSPDMFGGGANGSPNTPGEFIDNIYLRTQNSFVRRLKE